VDVAEKYSRDWLTRGARSSVWIDFENSSDPNINLFVVWFFMTNKKIQFDLISLV
jgi:hypothetical protein